MEPILRAPRPVDASGRLRGEVLISAKTRGLGWLRGGRAAPGTFLELGPEGLALSGLGGGAVPAAQLCPRPCGDLGAEAACSAQKASRRARVS